MERQGGHIKEKARNMTVVINKIEHDEEDGLAWKVETLADKEVNRKKKKRDNRTAEILLKVEGRKNKHSMLVIGDGRTSPAKRVNI